MARGRWFGMTAALGLALLGAVTAPACSSGGDGSGDGKGGRLPTGGAAGSKAAGGASGSSGASSGGGGGIRFDATPSGGSAGFDPDSSCVGQAYEGELIPLDLFIMLDISGSMTELTAAGTQKWVETRQALTAFLNDPQSAGLGVGIQFFPQAAPGVPQNCTTHQQCGSWGPCLLTVCQNAPLAPSGGRMVIPCATNTDCTNNTGPCVQLGACGGNPQSLCIPAGGYCAPGFPVGPPCTAITSSFCTKEDCDLSVYEKAAVAIGQLPANAQPLITAINAQLPQGATPTAPSLQGAVNYAKTFAQQNAQHTVVVVYATDGLPTECAPQDIPSISQIAAAAYSGTPSIRTFVVGVFAPSETAAPGNLNAIAAAGGTQTAFMIDTSQNVTMQLIAALNQIRGSVLACEFSIPIPADGGALDFDKVNVQVTDMGGNSTPLYYVGSKAQCDPATGGWYYDVDPASGGTPTKIIVCDSTCNVFKQSVRMRVDVRLGCQTQVKPPQ